MRYLTDVVTLQLDQGICTGCGMCEVVCPHAVFSLDNGLARIGDRDSCMECGACSVNCPEGAIQVQAGVGCAQAVINSALGRTGSACCDLEEYGTEETGCGSVDTEKRSGSNGCGCEEKQPGKTVSGCC